MTNETELLARIEKLEQQLAQNRLASVLARASDRNRPEDFQLTMLLWVVAEWLIQNPQRREYLAQLLHNQTDSYLETGYYTDWLKWIDGYVKTQSEP